MQPATTSSRLIRVAIALCASLLLVSGMASPALGDSGERNVAPPKAFYLSLGDSMAFGLQFDRLFEMLDAGTYTPDAFDTGYTGGLAARMRQLRRDQQTVNLSCPGESTATMIKGGCEYTLPEPDGPGLALHTDCEGPQLDAAVSFLRAHRRRVGPITVSIGGIDAAAPDAEIILVSFHNPFSISNPGTDRLWQRHYTAVQKGAARRNDVRVVDVAEIVNANNVCQLTFLCDSGDSHPTDAGYRRIAEQIFRVAGYRR